jgi:hypothetical protein
MATYGQFCPVAMASEVLTERWTPLVVRELHDASLLMWDIRRNIDIRRAPAHRTVVYFHVTGSSDGKSHFWLVLEGAAAADLCLTDPGHQVDVTVEAHVRTLVDYWMGHVDFAGAVRQGDITLQGRPRLTRAVATWFGRSPFAPVALPGTASL